MDHDPTAYELGGDHDHTDPRQRYIRGFTNHGGIYINMPFMTEVAPNLWQGGVEPGLVLPDFIDYKLSLFRWEEYEVKHKLKDALTVEMLDSVDQGLEQVHELAEWVNDRRKDGPVLVHCQAGLNRSSLVVAEALVLSGEAANGEDAITMVRAKRSEACLCNPAFEAWIRAL